MSLRRQIEDWQVRWAGRNGIRMGTAAGSVAKLDENLFEPLTQRAWQQFIGGAGSELDPPDGQSGHLYSVYSSTALLVNFLHPWTRPPDADSSRNAGDRAGPLLKACGLSGATATRIDFEVPVPVNPRFAKPPHVDALIRLSGSGWKCAAIEAKFCEPYGGKKQGGLYSVYLRERELWTGWPHLREFAGRLSPTDDVHTCLHAAQLIKHLLGLKKEYGAQAVLVYLWFDVPGEMAARLHREEVESFSAVLESDGIPFVSRTYQQLLKALEAEVDDSERRYIGYLRGRYMERWNTAGNEDAEPA